MNSYLQTDGHAPKGPARATSELRPPAHFVLHIQRCIGRDQQLHHLCLAAACCLMQRGVASAQPQHTAREGSEAQPEPFFQKLHQGPFQLKHTKSM